MASRSRQLGGVSKNFARAHSALTGSLDWTTGLDYWTGLLDSPLTPQIPTKMSNFSAVDNPRLQLCPLLCQFILSNRLSSQIGPSNNIMFSSSA